MGGFATDIVLIKSGEATANIIISVFGKSQL